MSEKKLSIGFDITYLWGFCFCICRFKLIDEYC